MIDDRSQRSWSYRTLVVDVGSNDGTCLKAFRARGFRVCGVDPAALPARIANENGIDTINADYARHSTAARALAEREFDARKVLGAMLERIGT